MDFTISIYKSLLQSLISKGYSFITFRDYVDPCVNIKDDSFVILRHDVDRLPLNSLRTAEIENDLGIKGTYYFRVVSESYDEAIIIKIKSLGHEIGYHYEDVDLVLRSNRSLVQKINGKIDIERLIDLAFASFRSNLEKLKRIAEIQTVCMHGSPLSKYDNKIIWNKHDYRKLGILGEPYLDLNWNDILYLTDTGRRWNGDNVSVRDKVISRYNLNFKSTADIINNVGELPARIMITIHPQRWDDNLINWVKELVAQSGKNIIKKYFFIRNKKYA